MGNTSFGQWLARRRKALDLTREELARRANVSVAMLRKIEDGERRPSKALAEAIAAAVAIPTYQRASFVRYARAESAEFPSEGTTGSAATNPQPSFTLSPDHFQHPNNLSPSLVSMVGREDELLRLRERIIRDEARLVTLVGPPGIGKTTLALEFARRALNDFSDGVFFVPLAPISDAELVAAAALQALDLANNPNQSPRQTLKLALHDKQLLLVFDNFEHVLEAATLLTELLRECFYIKLLVTSREPLRVRGERQIAIGVLGNDPAITLFEERAQAVDAEFLVNGCNAAEVHALCSTLGGMPLAIELAASWVGTLTCSEIAREIQHDFDFLATTMRDVPERHRSLRSAFDHSWRLITGEERRVLRSLSVFRGGFSREMAEQVAGATLDSLASLVTRSLLTRTSDGRFNLHELVRQYAAIKLQESGEESAIQFAHADAFAAMVELATLYVQNQSAQEWRKRLEVEQNNLRAALSWALHAALTGHTQAVLIGLRLGATLGRWWYLESLWQEGRQWLEKIIALQSGDDMDRLRGRALVELGGLTSAMGEFVLARRHFDEALRLSRGCGDDWSVAWTLYQQGHIALLHFEYAETEQLATQSLSIFTRLADRWGMALCLSRLADVSNHKGAYSHALQLLQESAALFEEVQDEGGLAGTCILSGIAYLDDGNFLRATELLLRGLQLHRHLNNRLGVRWALRSLGSAALKQENYEDASRYYHKALELSWELNSKTGITDLFMELSVIAARLNECERSARLFACAVALADSCESPISDEWRESKMGIIRSRLGESAFNLEWQAGMAMPLDQAVKYALEPIL